MIGRRREWIGRLPGPPRPGRSTRGRAALAGSALAAVVLLGWGLVEPRLVVVRHCTLRLRRWPAGLAGLRVAVVSDLHAGAPHVDERKVERIVDLVNRERPDLVALLGDYVDPDGPFGRRVAPAAVADRLAALRAPLGVHAVLGNHDWISEGPAMGRALVDAGIEVLEDRAVSVDHRGERLWIVGLADAETRAPNLAVAFDGVPREAPALALSHNPDLFPDIPDHVALTLSGHTHGGQVNLPVLRRRIIPSQFGDRFARGHIEEESGELFVSTGIGTTGVPIRFRVPPEVTVLRLVPR